MKFEISLEKDHQIQIGAHILKVKFVSSNFARLDGAHGCYVPKEFTLYINKEDPESVRLSSYFHEIIHAVEHLYTVELDHIVLNLIGECMAQMILSMKKQDAIRKTK